MWKCSRETVGGERTQSHNLLRPKVTLSFSSAIRSPVRGPESITREAIVNKSYTHCPNRVVAGLPPRRFHVFDFGTELDRVQQFRVPLRLCGCLRLLEFDFALFI